MEHLRTLVIVGLGLLSPICAAGYNDDYFNIIPPPGEMIQLPTHKLHLMKKGEGGPTIVFESALGADASWGIVSDSLAQHVTTVEYDRAGIMWSERGDNPKSILAMATELHQLLEAAEVSKPYILVGHSLGGLILRGFVSQYPEDVAGVVFVDVSHPEQGERFAREIPELPKVMFEENLLEDLQSGVRDEELSLPKLHTQAGKITSFGDKPLIVIASARNLGSWTNHDEGMHQQLKTSWLTMQREFLDLSSDSQFVLATESGHYVQSDQPQLVINTIYELLNRVR